MDVVNEASTVADDGLSVGSSSSAGHEQEPDLVFVSLLLDQQSSNNRITLPFYSGTAIDMDETSNEDLNQHELILQTKINWLQEKHVKEMDRLKQDHSNELAQLNQEHENKTNRSSSVINRLSIEIDRLKEDLRTEKKQRQEENDYYEKIIKQLKKENALLKKQSKAQGETLDVSETKQPASGDSSNSAENQNEKGQVKLGKSLVNRSVSLADSSSTDSNHQTASSSQGDNSQFLISDGGDTDVHNINCYEDYLDCAKNFAKVALGSQRVELAEQAIKLHQKVHQPQEQRFLEDIGPFNANLLPKNY